MRYFKKMVGERIYLSPINLDDFEIYTKWMNDPTVVLPLGMYTQAISLNSERALLEKWQNAHNYAIVRIEDDRLIGNIGFHEIHHEKRKTTFGLFIGDEENRGKGYGAEAIRLLLDYGFNTLNMHNIGLTMHADNERALACYKKVGLKEYGRRREAIYKNGKYCDVVCMDILEHEFRELYGNKT